jgi:hypothetical protein
MGMDSPLAATPVAVRGVHATRRLRRWNPRGSSAEPDLGDAATATAPRRRQGRLAGAGQGQVSSVGTKAKQSPVPLYINSYYYVFKEIKIKHSKINAYMFNKYSCICIKRLEMRAEKK